MNQSNSIRTKEKVYIRVNFVNLPPNKQLFIQYMVKQTNRGKVQKKSKTQKKEKKPTTKTKEGKCPNFEKLGKMVGGGKMKQLVEKKKLGSILEEKDIISYKKAPVAQPITSRAKPPTAYIGQKIVKGPFREGAFSRLLRSLSWNDLIGHLFGGNHYRPMQLVFDEKVEEAFYITDNIGQLNEEFSEKVEILGQDGKVERDFIERNKNGVFKLSECKDRDYVQSKFPILLKGWIMQYLIGQGDTGAHNIICNTGGEMVFIDFDDTRNTYDYQASDLFKLLFHRPIGLFKHEYTNWFQGNEELKKEIKDWLKKDVTEIIQEEKGILNDLEEKYLYTYNRKRMQERYDILVNLINK